MERRQGEIDSLLSQGRMNKLAQWKGLRKGGREGGREGAAEGWRSGGNEGQSTCLRNQAIKKRAREREREREKTSGL